MQELYARPGGESLASRRKESARTGPAVSGDLFSFEGLLSDIGTIMPSLKGPPRIFGSPSGSTITESIDIAFTRENPILIHVAEPPPSPNPPRSRSSVSASPDLVSRAGAN
jgi:hypothetical protein